MFGDLYAVMREHTGIGQFARVSLVFRRYTKAIRLEAPIRAVMTLVAGVARLLGVTTRSHRALTRRQTS